MLRRLTAALAVACLITPALAAPPPACETLEQSRAEAVKLSEKLGAGYVELDGDDAHRFLTAINGMGQPSAFKADHLGLMLFADKGAGMIVLADKPCRGSMGYGQAVVMPISAVLQAYAAVRNGPKPKEGGI